jgi:hypothetical protein
MVTGYIDNENRSQNPCAAHRPAVLVHASQRRLTETNCAPFPEVVEEDGIWRQPQPVDDFEYEAIGRGEVITKSRADRSPSGQSVATARCKAEAMPHRASALGQHGIFEV